MNANRVKLSLSIGMGKGMWPTPAKTIDLCETTVECRSKEDREGLYDLLHTIPEPFLLLISEITPRSTAELAAEAEYLRMRFEQTNDQLNAKMAEQPKLDLSPIAESNLKGVGELYSEVNPITGTTPKVDGFETITPNAKTAAAVAEAVESAKQDLATEPFYMSQVNDLTHYETVDPQAFKSTSGMWGTAGWIWGGDKAEITKRIESQKAIVSMAKQRLEREEKELKAREAEQNRLLKAAEEREKSTCVSCGAKHGEWHALWCLGGIGRHGGFITGTTGDNKGTWLDELTEPQCRREEDVERKRVADLRSQLEASHRRLGMIVEHNKKFPGPGVADATPGTEKAVPSS
jgi:hypothetical protein